MKDVARVAEVSVQTVSAVVNDKPGISEPTRARVLEAVESLGYQPFQYARSMRTRETRTIAFVVSDIANPSFATMASAVEDFAHSQSYSVVVYNTHDDADREAAYIQRASQRWVDGMLFVSAEDRVTGLERLEALGIASVAVDRIPVAYEGPSVTLDNVRAGVMAAEHLLSLGHTRIAHIAGPLRLRLARERMAGFKRAVESHGLDPGCCVHIEGNWGCSTGYAAMNQILRMTPRPTAVFAANDRMAMGAMKAVFEAGLGVPGDVSVVGLDDIEVANYQIPPLTTVRQCFAEMGTIAVRLLLTLLGDEEPSQTQIVMDPQLVVRQSTSALPGRVSRQRR
jgi:LacI family transcriptional regulator